MAQLENIEAIERRLWSAADQLRANSNHASNECFPHSLNAHDLRTVAGCPVERRGGDGPAHRDDLRREKEATRDAVKVTMRDCLWSDVVGLPAPAYTEAEVELKSADVFRHVYYADPTVPSPVYAVVAIQQLAPA